MLPAHRPTNQILIYSHPQILRFRSSRVSDTQEPKEPMVPCLQCHVLVPERQIVRLYGKQLCWGCAAAWFGDEDDPDEETD